MRMAVLGRPCWADAADVLQLESVEPPLLHDPRPRLIFCTSALSCLSASLVDMALALLRSARAGAAASVRIAAVASAHSSTPAVVRCFATQADATAASKVGRTLPCLHFNLLYNRVRLRKA